MDFDTKKSLNEFFLRNLIQEKCALLINQRSCDGIEYPAHSKIAIGARGRVRLLFSSFSLSSEPSELCDPNLVTRTATHAPISTLFYSSGPKFLRIF